MKKIFLLILFCFPLLSFGQLYINGHVYYKNTHEPIPNDTVRLKGSDGTDIIVKTDSLGSYLIDSRHSSPKVSYIISVINWQTRYYFVIAKDTVRSAVKTQVDTITKDFALSSPMLFEGSTPYHFYVPNFSKNSIIFPNGLKDSLLDDWCDLLLNNSKLKIEIDGHADKKETHPLKLSQARARACREYFISKGVDSERVVAKGWGDSKLLIRQSDIREMKTQSEKDSLSQRNARIAFQILSWDYPKK
jgi:hypothetical protein